MNAERTTSFGEHHTLSLVDRFGTWLSTRRVLRVLGDVDGKVLADVGCGFDARFGLSLAHRLGQFIAVDVSLSEKVASTPNGKAIVGLLPEVLRSVESKTVDFAVLNSVLEHLENPQQTLSELRRVIRSDGGVVFVNVPTWLGKRALETSAFRLNLSPQLEIEDHRRYYSARELWQALRDVGFLPSEIKVRHHKFGLNVYAVCVIKSS